MKFTYVLLTDNRPVKSTQCLDEATIHKFNGGGFVEVPVSETEQLYSEVNEETETITNEDGEVILTVTPDIINDPHEHLLHDGSVSHYTDNYEVYDMKVNDTPLKDLNLTEELYKDIESNCESIAQTEQENNE